MNERNYKVYVHIFPNGKKYIGYTCKPLKERWVGGLGYEDQKTIFRAILDFGWNNIRHYILFENLSKDDAVCYEAAYINGWKTYMKGHGYNTVLPNIHGMKDIDVIPFGKCAKRKIEDIYDEDIRIRRDRRYDPDSQSKSKARRVQCIETGEIFANAETASMAYGNGKPTNTYYAIKHNTAMGTCSVYSEEDGRYFEVPAHWEFVS